MELLTTLLNYLSTHSHSPHSPPLLFTVTGFKAFIFLYGGMTRCMRRVGYRTLAFVRRRDSKEGASQPISDAGIKE